MDQFTLAPDLKFHNSPYAIHPEKSVDIFL